MSPHGPMPYPRGWWPATFVALVGLTLSFLVGWFVDASVTGRAITGGTLAALMLASAVLMKVSGWLAHKVERMATHVIERTALGGSLRDGG